MLKKYVITGATGFIGAAIVAELLRQGAQVMILIRAESNCDRLLKLNGFELCKYTNLNDLELIGSLERFQPDVFIHCAWKGVGGGDRNQAYQVTENVSLTIQSVELAAAIGCRQWIGLGSQAEYGNQNCRLDENASIRPTTLYGKAKLAAGVAALGLCEALNLSGVWMRVFSTYGPGDSPNWFIPYVIREFLADRSPHLTLCEQQWDYLYVDDAARAVCALADGLTTGVFNLGSGSVRPLKDYVEAIKRELNTSLQPVYGSVPYRVDQVMHLEADITHLTNASGWEPKTSLEQGISCTVKSFLMKR